MKFVLSLFCLLTLCLCTEASDRKSKGHGAWAWASACSQCQPATVPQRQEPLARPAPTQPTEYVMPASQGTYSSGDCVNGQCSPPTRYSRRGR